MFGLYVFLIINHQVITITQHRYDIHTRIHTRGVLTFLSIKVRLARVSNHPASQLVPQQRYETIPQLEEELEVFNILRISGKNYK